MFRIRYGVFSLVFSSSLFLECMQSRLSQIFSTCFRLKNECTLACMEYSASAIWLIFSATIPSSMVGPAYCQRGLCLLVNES